MSHPVIHAFFVGKALADITYEKAEDTFANALSELGKFDAEQRENLRQFTTEVLARAEREMARQTGSTTTTTNSNTSTQYNAPTTPRDTQEVIDDLRHQIAQTRAEITAYRAQKSVS
jgi:carboxylesterase type B